MRVAVITQWGTWSACTRYRALQHVPRLAERLGEVCFLPPDDEVPRGPGGLGRVAFFARHAHRYASRSRQVSRALSDTDAVLVQRGVYPMGPGWVVDALERFEGRVVCDLDDAVFLPSPALSRKWKGARWLYGPQQTLRLLRRADAVVVSTHGLAAALPEGIRADAVLPTVPDPAHYPAAVHDGGRPALVGWVGTAGNLPYLDELRDVFARLAAEGVLRLEVVSSAAWDGPAAFRRWTEADEASVFARYAIGIMPLPDTPYTRAKAGFKLLQSMAASVPVIASPVGVNRELVEASGAGFLASTPVEWDVALRELAASAELRAELGRRGRRFVERYADLDGQADRLAALLAGKP